MKLKNILIVVDDIEKSKRFYKALFCLDIVSYNEGNAILTGGLVLQDRKIWENYLGKDVIVPNHAAELYFEESDIESFVKKLEAYEEQIQYVNPLTKFPWGQKMLRIYDPNGNLIEVRTPE